MHLSVCPVDKRAVHPDFSLRVHGEADYSSGFEEASSKRAAQALPWETSYCALLGRRLVSALMRQARRLAA